MSLVRYLTHRLVLLSLLVSLGIAGLLARNLWVVHENALASAELANRNLSHTLAVGLQWVLAEVDHDIFQVRNVLHHRDHKTWDMHAVLALSGSELLVLDEYGDGVRDMVLGKSTQPLGPGVPARTGRAGINHQRLGRFHAVLVAPGNKGLAQAVLVFPVGDIGQFLG